VSSDNDNDPNLSVAASAIAEMLADPDFRALYDAGALSALAQRIEGSLAADDLYLMHWSEKRVPMKAELVSVTPAGPIKLTGTDYAGMGIRATVEAQLTGAAMLLNLPYADAGKFGAWLVARSMVADVRRRKDLKSKNAGADAPGGNDAMSVLPGAPQDEQHVDDQPAG
jgi:hypothetical protein